MFAMDVYNENGRPLSTLQLYNHLQNIVNQSATPADVQLGIMTTEHRDTWAKVFKLISQGIGNVLLGKWEYSQTSNQLSFYENILSFSFKSTYLTEYLMFGKCSVNPHQL